MTTERVTKAIPRNAGPEWGYDAIRIATRILPQRMQNWVSAVGGQVAYHRMPQQREHSRAYLKNILGHEPSYAERIRHFREFSDYLFAKLKAGQGQQPVFSWADSISEKNGNLLHSRTPLLLGSFHFGAADILGFHLGQLGRKVTMVRQRMGNASDVDRLASKGRGAVEIVWAQEMDEMIFRIRDVLEAGGSLAVQCDRIDYVSKTSEFLFLGEQRPFPVTIYHLARLFRRPVIFSVGLPAAKPLHYNVHVCEPFFCDDEHCPSMEEGIQHFQHVLRWLESLMLQHPFQWFNFQQQPVGLAVHRTA